MGMEHRGYAPEELRRNRRNIIMLAGITLAVLVVAGVVSSSTSAALGLIGVGALLLALFAGLWWLFASKGAGKHEVRTDEDAFTNFYGGPWPS